MSQEFAVSLQSQSSEPSPPNVDSPPEQKKPKTFPMDVFTRLRISLANIVEDADTHDELPWYMGQNKPSRLIDSLPAHQRNSRTKDFQLVRKMIEDGRGAEVLAGLPEIGLDKVVTPAAEDYFVDMSKHLMWFRSDHDVMHPSERDCPLQPWHWKGAVFDPLIEHGYGAALLRKLIPRQLESLPATYPVLMKTLTELVEKSVRPQYKEVIRDITLPSFLRKDSSQASLSGYEVINLLPTRLDFSQIDMWWSDFFVTLIMKGYGQELIDRGLDFKRLNTDFADLDLPQLMILRAQVLKDNEQDYLGDIKVESLVESLSELADMFTRDYLIAQRFVKSKNQEIVELALQELSETTQEEFIDHPEICEAIAEILHFGTFERSKINILASLPIESIDGLIYLKAEQPALADLFIQNFPQEVKNIAVSWLSEMTIAEFEDNLFVEEYLSEISNFDLSEPFVTEIVSALPVHDVPSLLHLYRITHGSTFVDGPDFFALFVKTQKDKMSRIEAEFEDINEEDFLVLGSFFVDLLRALANLTSNKKRVTHLFAKLPIFSLEAFLAFQKFSTDSEIYYHHFASAYWEPVRDKLEKCFAKLGSADLAEHKDDLSGIFKFLYKSGVNEPQLAEVISMLPIYTFEDFSFLAQVSHRVMRIFVQQRPEMANILVRSISAVDLKLAGQADAARYHEFIGKIKDGLEAMAVVPKCQEAVAGLPYDHWLNLVNIHEICPRACELVFSKRPDVIKKLIKGVDKNYFFKPAAEVHLGRFLFLIINHEETEELIGLLPIHDFWSLIRLSQLLFIPNGQGSRYKEYQDLALQAYVQQRPKHVKQILQQTDPILLSDLTASEGLVTDEGLKPKIYATLKHRKTSLSMQPCGPIGTPLNTIVANDNLEIVNPEFLSINSLEDLAKLDAANSSLFNLYVTQNVDSIKEMMPKNMAELDFAAHDNFVTRVLTILSKSSKLDCLPIASLADLHQLFRVSDLLLERFVEAEPELSLTLLPTRITMNALRGKLRFLLPVISKLAESEHSSKVLEKLGGVRLLRVSSAAEREFLLKLIKMQPQEMLTLLPDQITFDEITQMPEENLDMLELFIKQGSAQEIYSKLEGIFYLADAKADKIKSLLRKAEIKIGIIPEKVRIKDESGKRTTVLAEEAIRIDQEKGDVFAQENKRVYFVSNKVKPKQEQEDVSLHDESSPSRRNFRLQHGRKWRAQLARTRNHWTDRARRERKHAFGKP